MSHGRVVLKIGEYYASREPAVIYTLLGSCVAVCLFDPGVRVGGMNHILLPGENRSTSYEDAGGRFGINAMELLINRMMQLGAQRDRMEAKVFGGGNVLSSMDASSGVGEKNVLFILDFLRTEGFLVLGRNTGGQFIRKIFYHTFTGEAFLKKSRPSRLHQQDLLLERRKLRDASGLIDQGAEITLFDEIL